MSPEHLKQLQNYAELEGSEYGDYVRGILSAYYVVNTSYGASEEFVESYNHELETVLQFFKENTTIIEHPRQLTVVDRELEWKD